MDTIFYYLAVISLYFIGIVLSIFALWRSRTPQGAIAWIIGLISFPFVSIPLFSIFGRNKFYQYVGKRKLLDQSADDAFQKIEKLYQSQKEMPEMFTKIETIVEKIQKVKFTSGNKVDLLIDGEKTFSAILSSIENAQKYVLFQFYIFNDDSTGNLFKESLIRKAQNGVKIYFIYDYVGSSISKKSIQEMKNAGVEINPFKSTKSWLNRPQINFRNHRKLVVVDGQTAFVGGHNIGDEYVGKSEIGHWRDTHVKIQGPAALASQICFAKDWYWATQNIPNLEWVIEENTDPNSTDVCMLYTGPADEIEVCQLAHMSLVQIAKKRLLISTPYFVPSESFINELILAALRGCEIKIILPIKNDNKFIQAAEKVYIEKLLPFGIKFYQYNNGFLHHKIMLVDEHTSLIGSTNLDARSFFINFEIGAIMVNKKLAKEVEIMFEKDLNLSKAFDESNIKKMKLHEKIFSRAANLLSPML